MPNSVLFACPFPLSGGQASASSRLGGIETANLELTRALQRRGGKILLASHDEWLEEPGITHVPWGNLGAVGGYSVVVASNDARVFDLAAKAARKVWWLHNPFALEKLYRKGSLGPLLRHRPDTVFLGTVAAQKFNKIVPLRSRRVIPYGIQALFREHAIDGPRQPIFVWASQPQRGLPETLQAWQTHAPAGQLHVYGCTPQQGRISEQDAARCQVRFMPRSGKAGLVQAYAGALAMIYPGAHDETFCLAAAEAQNMGLPVITMGIGSLRERVQDGVNGVICRSHVEMMDAAARLVTDRKLWSRLSEGAIRTSRLLTWDRAAQEWEKLLGL